MNEKELLNKILKYQFFAVELNLFLDNFPNNEKALEDFQSISKRLKELICEYEEKVGPLMNFGMSSVADSKAWVNQPWPWEREMWEGLK